MRKDNSVPSGACKTFFNRNDVETLEGQKLSVDAICCKSSDAPFDKSDPKETYLYGASDKSEDDKTDADEDGPLYSDLFHKPPPSKRKLPM